MTDETRTFLHPIIDWSDAEVWQFIREERISYCSLYDEGFTRLGCILCPMSDNARRDIDRWPKIAAQYVRTFQQVVEIRQEAGKRCTFATGQEMFSWWIRHRTKGSNDSQPVLFE